MGSGAASAADCTSKLAPLPAETDAASVRTSSTLLYPQRCLVVGSSSIPFQSRSTPTDAEQHPLHIPEGAQLPAESDAASIRTSSTLLYPPSKWTYAQTYPAIDPSDIQLAEPSMPTDA